MLKTLRFHRFHDPFSCVMYEIEKKLLGDINWNWTKDFIHNTKQYRRLLYALKTSKNFGPKYKLGVEVPGSVKHALFIDQRSNNNLLKEAIDKELKQLDDFNVFRFPKTGESLAEYQQLPHHMVFDVKFDL